jgi:hypothetical protein
MLSKCLINNFACEIRIFWRINLTSQFSTKTLTFFFPSPYIHVGNTLFVDDTPYKSMFNGLYSAIILESFHDHHGEDQYLLGIVFLYLENLHSSRYNVPTFVEHNPFGRIGCIDQDNPRFFKMIFLKCSWTCQPTFYNSVKLK